MYPVFYLVVSTLYIVSILFVYLWKQLNILIMKTCADCGKQLESNHAKFCIDCKILKRRAVAKATKDKYQYHKQPKFRYATYKRGAESRGLDFKLSIKEFSSFWNTNCSYCNDVIQGIGLDRIDNNIGYTIDNIVACCTTCNWMKHKMSHETFINKCKAIALNC
jgi:hypothetical protein